MREAEVRAAITERVAREAGRTRLIEEMALCQAEARIDLAVVRLDVMSGWEIKTEADRLTRLAGQQEVYSRVFDRMWLAADPKHIRQAMAVVPAWWGIMRIERAPGGCHLAQVRPSRVNRAIDLRSLVTLLWRDEVIAELQAIGIQDGIERTPRKELWDRLAASAPRRTSAAGLRKRVRARLMNRTHWRADGPRTLDGDSS